MMLRKTIFCLLFVLTPAFALGTEQEDSVFDKLYERYYQLYQDTDATAFYDISRQMMDYYQKQGNTQSYYKVMLNEVLYDSEQGQSYRAIKKAGELLEIMKQKGDKHYYIVYSALGSLYETRGNYRLANRYYTDALNNCEPKDTNALMSIYSRLAELKADREPKKAWEYNEKFGALSKNSPQYYKMYLVFKANICLYLNDKQQFLKTYAEFQDYCKQHADLLVFGNTLMSVVYDTFQGNYDKALNTLDASTSDFTELERCELRIKLYRMMGEEEKALEEVNRRRDLRDSLNSNMLFENINEINTEMGIAKLNEQAAKEREIWLAIVIVLLAAALGLIVWRYLTRRRYQKELIKQNKELEIALDHAQESDRMKDSFIEHVSHEIRTPLNVITGYAQIITNPSYELKEEERNRMLNDISKNTNAITEIVNELLEVAQDESKKHYQKDDTIVVNSLCKELMAKAEQRNNGRLTLTFNSELADDFTFRCHRQAVEKVLEHLLGNALKFTKEGSVDLHVHESPDHGVVRFVVTDTGIGIPEEHRNHIFERFYKVDMFKQGFGLGLTMSLKMAILLDGSLVLDNSYKDGSRFILTLPIG